MNLPYGMTPKQQALDQVIFAMPVVARLELEKILTSGQPRARVAMGVTQIVVKQARPRDADLVEAILPLLRQDCLALARG